MRAEISGKDTHHDHKDQFRNAQRHKRQGTEHSRRIKRKKNNNEKSGLFHLLTASKGGLETAFDISRMICAAEIFSIFAAEFTVILCEIV